MRGLGRKQQTGLIFGFYLFMSALVLIGVATLGYRLVLESQVKDEINREVTVILQEHLAVENGFLSLKTDSNGETLAEHLRWGGMGAALFNQNDELVRSYGFFDTVFPSNLIDPKKMGYWQNVEWGERNLLAIAQPLKFEGKQIGSLVVAKNLSDVNNKTNTTLILMVIISGLSLAGSVILGYWLAKRTFEPLEEITKIVGNIDLNNLAQRIKTGNNEDDEIEKLAVKLNTMMERLEDMTDFQKSFISNVSHEIKTPLTRAIGRMEVSKINGGHGDSADETVNDLMQIKETIDGVLKLSQMSKGLEKVAVLSVWDKVKEEYQEQMKSKNLRLFETNSKEIMMMMSPTHLKTILRNILSNAIKNSPDGETIEIESGTLGKRGYLLISNKSENTVDTDKIFERYYRENKHNEGQGIGLSLVRQIGMVYGVKVKAASRRNWVTIGLEWTV